MSAQLELLDGLKEASLYHDSARKGFFSILWREPEAAAFEQCDALAGWGHQALSAHKDPRTRQESYPLDQMARVIPMLRKDRDTWLSQAEFFRPNRRLVNLLRLPICFVDIDTYKTEYAALTQEQALRDILTRLDDEGLPWPSLVVSSGRGLQAKWLLQGALPRQALPRWTAVQRALCRTLEPFGGDMQATDASRVLRLVNTVNTKAGMRAEVVYTCERNGRLAHYDFDELADAALPLTRAEIEAQREAASRRGRRGLVVIDGGRSMPRGGRASWAAYNWLRLEDLRKLSAIRHGEQGVPEGWRDLFVFHATLSSALSLPHLACANHLTREACQLAKELAPTLSHREAVAYTSSVVARAKKAAAGEKVIYRGREVSPLYTYKTSTMLETFQITASEQQSLRVLISKDEGDRRRRKRDKERKRKERRAAGMLERGAYEGRSQERAEVARRLALEGLSQTAIAERLGVSLRSVVYYLAS